MAEQIVFSILAVVTLVSGFIVVTDRNLFHAAIALMLSFLGVAGFYVMLDMGFMAAAQLLVYIGAITILIIFAIMMTRRLMSTTESAFNSQWLAGAIASVLVFVLLGYVIFQVWATNIFPDSHTMPDESVGVTQEFLSEQVVVIGRQLVSSDAYVLPFELASVLLLAALVGSIVIARPQKDEE